VVMYEVARQRRSRPAPQIAEASPKKRKGLGS
jgi:hypothetical protein